MEPQRARTRSGLAYSAATPSGLRGKPEVGTDVSPGVEMVEVGVGMEMQPTSKNQSPPTSTPERLPLDYQLDTNPPNPLTQTQNFTLVPSTSRNTGVSSVAAEIENVSDTNGCHDDDVDLRCCETLGNSPTITSHGLNVALASPVPYTGGKRGQPSFPRNFTPPPEIRDSIRPLSRSRTPIVDSSDMAEYAELGPLQRWPAMSLANIVREGARNASAASPFEVPTDSRPLPPPTSQSISPASSLPSTRITHKSTLELQAAHEDFVKLTHRLLDTLSDTLTHQQENQVRRENDYRADELKRQHQLAMALTDAADQRARDLTDAADRRAQDLVIAAEQRTKELIMAADERARDLIAVTENIQTLTDRHTNELKQANEKRIQDILTLVDQQQRTAAEAAVRAADSRIAYEQQLTQERLRFALLQEQLNSCAYQRADAKSTAMPSLQNTNSSGCEDAPIATATISSTDIGLHKTYAPSSNDMLSSSIFIPPQDDNTEIVTPPSSFQNASSDLNPSVSPHAVGPLTTTFNREIPCSTAAAAHTTAPSQLTVTSLTPAMITDTTTETRGSTFAATGQNSRHVDVSHTPINRGSEGTTALNLSASPNMSQMPTLDCKASQSDTHHSDVVVTRAGSAATQCEISSATPGNSHTIISSSQQSAANLKPHTTSTTSQPAPVVVVKQTQLPKPYNGTTNWRSFRDHFNRVARVNGWDTDHEKFQQLSLALEGSAVDCLTDVNENSPSAYTDLWQAIAKRFGLYDETREMMRTFDNRRQLDSENVVEFQTALRLLHKRAWPNATQQEQDSALKRKFEDGLSSPEMAQFLRLHARNDDFTETVRKARQFVDATETTRPKKAVRLVTESGHNDAHSTQTDYQPLLDNIERIVNAAMQQPTAQRNRQQSPTVRYVRNTNENTGRSRSTSRSPRPNQNGNRPFSPMFANRPQQTRRADYQNLPRQSPFRTQYGQQGQRPFRERNDGLRNRFGGERGPYDRNPTLRGTQTDRGTSDINNFGPPVVRRSLNQGCYVCGAYGCHSSNHRQTPPQRHQQQAPRQGIPENQTTAPMSQQRNAPRSSWTGDRAPTPLSARRPRSN